MMRRAGILAGLVIVSGCSKEAAETKRTDNENFRVERLFTVDGCTVYRFHDAGDARYFSSCAGAVSWTETTGKLHINKSVPTHGVARPGEKS